MNISRSAFILGLGIAASLVANKANAQLTLDQTMTVEELVTEVLLGDGVNATNITFNGMPANTVSLQTGSFSATNTAFPIEQGLIMATGNAQMMLPNGDFGIIDNLQDDPDLMVLAGFPVNNCAIIEFDFTVESDSVIFDYIFASNEYTQWTCSSFNDVFGFFLSGPDINGPFTDNAINIALIPNSNTFVGVNSVNQGFPGTNGTIPFCLEANPNFVEDSQYYINNAGGQGGISSYLNGHTTLLTARSPIVCSGNYHIKMAIGNAVDQGLQSAVFLRKGSFSAAGEVFVSVVPSLPGVNLEGTGFENVIVAGCFSPLVQLVRPQGAPLGNIFVSYGGSAVEGLDYLLGENDTLFAFSDGVDTLTFNITTFANPNAADTIYLDFFVIYETCSGLDTVTASIPIIQPYEISSATENVTVTCPADSTVISALGLGGVPPYNYDWIGQSPGQEILVPVPPDEIWYVVNITDQCEFEIRVDSVLVINNIPPPLALSLPQTVQPLCPTMPVTVQAIVTDGNGEYAFLWTPVPSATNEVVVNFPASQMVYLTVIDTCGTQRSDSVFVTYPEYEDIVLTLDVDRRTCPESPLRLEVEATGGAGNNSYIWSLDAGEGNFSEALMAATEFVPVPGLSALNVQVIDQCVQLGFIGPYIGFTNAKDTLKTIDLTKVPNVITPNNDGVNDFFAVQGLDMFPGTGFQVWNRWGNSIFESTDYRVNDIESSFSNAFTGRDQENGSYFFILNVNSGECVKSGYLQLLGSDVRVRR